MAKITARSPPAAAARRRGLQDLHAEDVGDRHRAGRRGVTARLSFRLIHSCSHRFTCDRRLGFRAAQDAGGRRGTVVHSPRKRVKGQPFRGFKSHLHRHSPAPTPALTDGSRVPQPPVVSFIGLSYEPRTVPPPGPAATVVPGHGCCGRPWTALNRSTHAAEACTPAVQGRSRSSGERAPSRLIVRRRCGPGRDGREPGP